MASSVFYIIANTSNIFPFQYSDYNGVPYRSCMFSSSGIRVTHLGRLHKQEKNRNKTLIRLQHITCVLPSTVTTQFRKHTWRSLTQTTQSPVVDLKEARTRQSWWPNHYPNTKKQLTRTETMPRKQNYRTHQITIKQNIYHNHTISLSHGYKTYWMWQVSQTRLHAPPSLLDGRGDSTSLFRLQTLASGGNG